MKNNKLVYKKRKILLFLLVGAISGSFFIEVNAQMIINGPEYALVDNQEIIENSSDLLRNTLSEDMGNVIIQSIPPAPQSKVTTKENTQTSVWKRNGKEISSSDIVTVEVNTQENKDSPPLTRTLQTFKLWVSQLFTSDTLTLTSRGSLTSSDIASVVGKKETTISWNANKLALGRVYYDTESPLIIGSSTSWFNASNYGNYANSQATLYRLNAKTTYYFKIVLQDASGEIDISPENSFTTK